MASASAYISAAVPGLARLDEVGVLGETGGVHDDRDTVFVAQGAGRLDVLHGDGLPADGIVRNGEDHERDVPGILLQYLLEFLQADVSLERDLELGVLGFVGRDVDGLGLAGFDMALGRVEMGIAGDDVAFLYEIGEENVFSGSALVRRDDVRHAEKALDRSFQLVERAGAGIALVAHHEGGPLAVGHGARAGIGQQVDIDLLGLQLKYIVMCFPEPLLALLAGAAADGLDHFDLPGLSKRKFHRFGY